MKVVNCQSSEVHEINVVIHQGSLLISTLFLLFINQKSKNILWSLVNIYVDDRTVYRCTFSQNLDDQNLAANLTSDLDLVAQCGKDWLVKFNTSPINE